MSSGWVRGALFTAFFYGLTFLLVWPGQVVRFAAPGRLLGFARFWARCVLAGLRLICGVRVRVAGIGHLPAEGPALVAPMHQSALDTLIWTLLLPRCCYVLKQELIRIPLFGGMLKGAGMIAVDRGAGVAALRSVVRAGTAAAADGRQLVVFPQGTRAAPDAPLCLQPGIAALAHATALNVIPAATNSGLHWPRHGLAKHPGTVFVRIGPAIEAGLPREAMLSRIERAWQISTGFAEEVWTTL